MASRVSYLNYPNGGENDDPVSYLHALGDDQCPKCGADLDDGECEECERVAPLDFDT